MSLVVTPKFKYHRNSKSLSTFRDSTNVWNAKHIYRTSYNDMSCKVGAEDDCSRLWIGRVM